MKTESILWLLPVIFMLHDFEEIIFLKMWLRKNRDAFQARYPRIARPVIAQLDALSTLSFTLIVAEEFLLLSLVTLLAVEQNLYNIFAGFVGAYLLHLIVHWAQAFIWKGYIPGVVTAAITALYCLFALYTLGTRGLIDLSSVVFWTAWASIAALGNLLIGHISARKFERWLRKVFA